MVVSLAFSKIRFIISTDDLISLWLHRNNFCLSKKKKQIHMPFFFFKAFTNKDAGMFCTFSARTCQHESLKYHLKKSFKQLFSDIPFYSKYFGTLSYVAAKHGSTCMTRNTLLKNFKLEHTVFLKIKHCQENLFMVILSETLLLFDFFFI